MILYYLLKEGAHKNKKEVAHMVKDWLEEEGLAIEYLDDEDTDVNCAIIKDNIILNVSFLKAAKDSLIVSGKVEIQPHQEGMQESTKLERGSLYDLEIVFLQMNLDFTIDDTNGVGDRVSISDIQIQKTVFFDGLSKDRLFDIMVSIFNCINVVRMKFILLGRTKSS
jgi:hypothetical protein